MDVTALRQRRAALSAGRLVDFATAPSNTIVLAVLIAGVLGIAVVAKPSAVMALVLLAVMATGIVAALAQPAIAFGGLVVALGLLPTYAAPEVGSILLVPGAAGCWVVGLVLLWRNFMRDGAVFRPNYVDLAAILLIILMGVSVAFSLRAKPSDFRHLMFLWLGPWLAARLLLTKVQSPAKVAAISFAIVALIVAPIAVSESLGGSNPFYNLNFNSGEFSIWATQISRFGSVRAVTSFGHPIAFSMFMATSALLSFAMGLASKSNKQRLIWYAIAVVTVGAMALSLSRTGWVMIAAGVLLLGLVALRGPHANQILILMALGAGALVLVAALGPHLLSSLPGFGHSNEASYRGSGQYREALLNRALQPGVLHLWGNAQNEITSGVGLETATDNAYIILADTWGLIPTTALFLLGGSLLIASLRRTPADMLEPIAVIPIVAFSSFVAIFFVAFITQQQCFIWLLIGGAGAAVERLRSQRRSQPARAAISDGSAPSTGDSTNTGSARRRSGWQPDRSVGSPSG